MSKEFTLSSAATATTNVTSSTPCQDAKLTVWAIDPMYCTIAGYSYSDGMAMQITITIKTITGRVANNFYGVGLSGGASQKGTSFLAKLGNASGDAGSAALEYKSCAANKPVTTNATSVCNTSFSSGDKPVMELNYSTQSATPTLAQNGVIWVKTLYKKSQSNVTAWSPKNTQSATVTCIKQNANAANATFTTANISSGTIALTGIEAAKAAYSPSNKMMVTNPTMAYDKTALPCQATQLTFTAQVTNDNKYDSTVAAYSNGIYATLTMKIVTVGIAQTATAGTVNGAWIDGSVVGSCLGLTSQANTWRAVCFWAVANAGAMKTGKKTTVALFVGNSNKLDNNANTLTASGAGIETDGAEATAKKYAVEVTPAAGCSACLVKDSIVTASWMTPKTANAADPFVVANNMQIFSVCMGADVRGVKKVKTTTYGSQTLTGLVAAVTQTAATTATVDGNAMASFAAGKCPEVKMLLTGLAKGTKVTDATEAKYTDGYKIKNSLKLGEAFATASSQIGVCYKSVTKAKNPAVCHFGKSGTTAGNMEKQDSCYIKNDKWSATKFTPGDCTAQDASAKFTTVAPNTDNKAFIGGLNASGDVVQATWNQPIETETYAKSPRLSKDEMVAPYCIMGTTMSTPTAAGVKLTGAVALMTSLAGVALGGIALSI